MTVQMSPLTNSSGTNGSSLVQMGLTSVLCAVVGPIDCVRKSDELTDKAVLEVNVRIAPFAPSTGDRLAPRSRRRA